VTDASPGFSLEGGMNLSGMSYSQLWMRQVSVGGDLDRLEVEAYVLGVLRPDSYRHNVLAQAINEHFIDQGGDHPVAYDDGSA
jgi:hypothetical protein